MGIGQAVVATSGNAVDEGTERPEAGRHIGRGQGSQVAEVVQTETVQEVDELEGNTPHVGEHPHRQGGKEGGRGFAAGGHDQGLSDLGGTASGEAGGEATIGHTAARVAVATMVADMEASPPK